MNGIDPISLVVSGKVKGQKNGQAAMVTVRDPEIAADAKRKAIAAFGFLVG
jgi:hypothetical protein